MDTPDGLARLPVCPKCDHPHQPSLGGICIGCPCPGPDDDLGPDDDPCLCGHNPAEHLDDRGEWVDCSRCGCLGYTEPIELDPDEL